MDGVEVEDVNPHVFEFLDVLCEVVEGSGLDAFYGSVVDGACSEVSYEGVIHD